MLPEETRIFDLLNYEASISDDYYLSGTQSAAPDQEANKPRSTYRPFNSDNRLATIISLPATNYDSISDCISALNHDLDVLVWAKVAN